MHAADLEVNETAADTAAHIQKAMAHGEARFESRHRRKDGSAFDISVSIHYRPVEGGRLVAFLQDITERKHAEKLLRQKLEELQRWHDITLGREDRVQELKREVNAALAQLGEPARYPSQVGKPGPAAEKC
jgi:hypothetical protein